MKVHFIAIGGAVMHSLAIDLSRKGYKVTGSDDEIFEPARSNLLNAGLLPEQTGWFPEKITPDLDAVILGMHARKDNPELQKAQELGLKIYSFPEYLYQQSIHKKRVVIAGSHGKTTITAMIIHVLRFHQIPHDYLIGARIKGYDVMVRLTDAPLIVIEGDEYLTSSLDPRPKFLHYQPHIALISGIAWDHINVFPTFNDYTKQFLQLINSLPDDGYLVVCGEDPTIPGIIDQSNFRGTIIPYNLPQYKVTEGKTFIAAKNSFIELKIFGRHNLLNLKGALEVCKLLGITEEDFFRAISSFSGASGRLQILAQNDHSLVFRDFAHAPSKLKATVNAVKEQYPDHQLIAVMELHTYSSLRKDFLPHYSGTMENADEAVVFFDPHAIELKKLDPISESDVYQSFGKKNLMVISNPRNLEDYLRQLRLRQTCLLLMSSGNFGGLDISSIAGELIRD